METLPNGVTIRDFYAPRETRDLINGRVREEMLKRFPLENDKVRLDLLAAEYPKKQTFSLEEYEHALLHGGRLAMPLKGRVRLTDKASGHPLEEKEVTLANVPYMTDDGTFVYGGSHYSTSNQSRLKSGIYARSKENGELESHINIKQGTGPGMRLFMEPETGVFRARLQDSQIKLYPVLKALGVPDEHLMKKWGPEILKANQDAFDRKAFDKFYDKLLARKARPDATPEEKATEIADVLNKAQMDPEVNTRTLGVPHANLTTDALTDASAKLLRISRKEEAEDDRDSPANRTFHTVDDFLADRVRMDAGRLGQNLLYRATYDRSLKHLRPGYFSPQLEGLIVGNQLSSPISGINPVEAMDQQRRVVQTGEGGISSQDSIPVSARNVHAGQFGIIDPIRSSESGAIGVDQRFSIVAKKGSDNQVYYPLRNRRTGKVEYLSPVDLHGKIIAFPEAKSLESFKTPITNSVGIGSKLVVAPEAAPATVVPEVKQAADLLNLGKAKEKSDAKDWNSKHHLVRQMIEDAPDEWRIDSEDKGLTGVTHNPTGYRYHLPHHIVPSSLRNKTAAAQAIDLLNTTAPIDMPAGRPVAAMRNGKMTMVQPHEADYEMISPTHMFTETSNLVPMASSMKGARLFIASKYGVQALPMDNPEAPLVSNLDDETGESYNKTIGRRLGLKKSEVDGTVHKVHEKYVDIKGADGKIVRHDLKRHFTSNRKTATTEFPMVTEGQAVKAGDPIARNNYVDKDGNWALGKNLHVAFMPSPEGLGFEDAILVSDRASKRMTSQHQYGYDVEHKHGTQSDKKRFLSLFPNKYTNEQLAKLDDNGMVKPGATLNPGDPIFLSFSPRTLSSKDAALGNLHKVLRNSFQDRSQTWDHTHEGKVTHAVETRSGLRVNVATHQPLHSSDKVSALQGAKGVVSRVMPDDQMPHVNGEPLDIVINPAALIGRVNPNMVYEALLGKIAHKSGKPYVLPSFTKESFRDFVDSELQTHGISDTDTVTDPTTGRQIPGVLTGRQYFMKLEHTGDAKLSARGEGATDLNEQPVKGGFGGGKKLGGLQILALLSHGAPEVIKDSKLWRGGGDPEIWRRIRLGQPLPKPKTPFVYEKFLNMMKGAGINVHERPEGLHISAMTDSDIDQMAPHEIQNSETLNPRTKDPVAGGLMDFSLHGVDGKQWSHIKLDHAIPNPVMEQPIRRLLGLTENQMRDVISGKEGINGKRGPEALHEALSKLDLDSMEQDAKDTIRLGRKTKRDDAVKKLNFITGLKRAGIAPQDMMIHKIPVLPPTFRPISMMGDMMLTADANYLYKDLLTARDAYRANRQDLPDEDLADQRLAVYDAAKAVTGLGDPINVETADKGVKGFIKTIAGVGGPKCYDDETEILTENGWIPFPQYQDTSLQVGTLNPKTHELEFQTPSYVLHEPYQGTMVQTKTGKLDLLVTEGHWHYVEKIIKRSVAGTHKKGRRREVQPAMKIQAGDLAGKTQRVQYITSADSFRGETPDYCFEGCIPDKQAFAEFIGWWVAEGWIDNGEYCAVIAQKEGTRDAIRIDDMMGRLRIPFIRKEYSKKTDGVAHKAGYKFVYWTIANRGLVRWLQQNCGSGAENKKLSPEILSWEKDHQHAVLTAYLDGDGEQKDRQIADNTKRKTYFNMSSATSRRSRSSTVSKELVDSLERLCLQSGLGFRVTDILHEDHETWLKQYRFRIYGWNRVVVEYPEQTQKIENWHGMVHCVTVPNGLIFVRRNGRHAVSGNTGFFQAKVIGHPVNAVGRAAIIPDADLNMDEVGVPENMAWHSFEPLTMRTMVQSGVNAVEAAKQIEQRSPFAKKFLLQTMDKYHILYSRDPALHRFSIMGAKAVLKSGNGLRLSPLVVKPFNADFDGDQMNIHVPVSDEAQKEIREKMLPSKNLFSLRGQDIHYAPSQEFILGAHLATLRNTKKQSVTFNTKEEAKEAYKKKLIDIDTPITILS